MPVLGKRLDTPNIDAVLAYIKTWWTPEQLETQADLSLRYRRATRGNEDRSRTAGALWL